MKVKIDTRPLPIVIVARWWRFPVFLLLGYFLYYFYGQAPPEGLSVQGFRALIVFLTCLVLWVTHLLPLPVTGLFALVAPPLFVTVLAAPAPETDRPATSWLRPLRSRMPEAAPAPITRAVPTGRRSLPTSSLMVPPMIDVAPV